MYRQICDAFNATLIERMTGSVRLKMHAANAIDDGTRSPFGLYDETLATYGAGDRFKHDPAAGFIALWGLPLELASRVRTEALTPTGG